jgi:hypothetical protein
MPPTEEQLAAAVQALAKEAEAQREVERRSARTQISNLLSDSKIPAIDLFRTAGIDRITEKNHLLITSELIALPKESRVDFSVIQKSAKKYVVLDAICTGTQFREFTASDLNEIGLVPKANRALITHHLRLIPAEQRDSHAEIIAIVEQEVATIQSRKDRLAAIISQIKSNREG